MSIRSRLNLPAIILLALALPEFAGADAPAHWSFQTPRHPEPPATRETGWVRNPIDAFILQRLEAEGLEHAPEADRPTLLRRLCFDLTGLPPTPEEVAAFRDDREPGAFERVVDRLMASPRFGERQAQDWLDLARFADTDGFEFDAVRPDAWRYRDWVVRAFNEDMPYDRFLTWQLAGDEVEPDDPDAAIATGFNRCYPDMVDQNDQGLRRQHALDDITETVGLAFLGLTIGCARCHDHKFDPIAQADFYRLQAFFAPARFRDDYPVASPEVRAEHETRLSAWRSEQARVRARLIDLEAPARAELAPGPPPGLDDRTSAALARDAAERSPEEVGLVFKALAGDRRVRPEALEKALGPDPAQARAEALAELNRLESTAPARLPTARVIVENGPDAPPTFMRRRGDYQSPGQEVQPGFPGALSDQTPIVRPSSRSTGRRSALAEWLTKPDHPLTARVIVNRLWRHHFGRGIVATPSDFGAMGDEPTHPELLDWLATELVARGWGLKTIHRLIVTSATYRQSSRALKATSDADPANLLLGRYRRQRLDGEAIRDALLAVSGRLNPALGGPAIFPELPAELAHLGRGPIWPTSARASDRHRRSLYVFNRRNLRFPFFEAFDRPDPNASCPERAVTTIAPQALTLLNGRLAFDSASALAARVARESGPDTPARINHAYRLALGRDPDAAEIRLATAFLADDNAEDAGLTAFCLALLNLNEFVTID